MSKADTDTATDGGRWGFVEGLGIETDGGNQTVDLDDLRERHGSLENAWLDLVTDLRGWRHMAIRDENNSYAYDGAQETIKQLEAIVEAEPSLPEE